MRYNGLQLVIRMAVRKLDLAELTRYQDALILGAIREDIDYLAGKHKIREHWSLSHFSGAVLKGGFIPFFTASAPRMAQSYFDQALQALPANPARAFVLLGHASHLLIDMACPVHASRVAHWSDGYEWYVEANGEQLSQVPFDIPAPTADAQTMVAALADFTRQFEPDRTHHHWGQLLRWLGLRKPISRAVSAEQARRIIPVAAGHLAALYLHFMDKARA